MIDRLRPVAALHDDLIGEAVSLIDRSGVAAEIDAAADATRGVGGKPSQGITYTIKGVLAAMFCLVRLRRPVTAAAVLDLLLMWLTPQQQARLGVCADPVAISALGDRAEAHREYRRFHAWLGRRLAPLDSHPDVPARRTTNEEKTSIIHNRDVEQRAACEQALQLCDKLVNEIVAASVLDCNPIGYEGDIVADETIIQVAASAYGLGAKPHLQRPSVPAAKIFVRSQGVVSDDPDAARKATMTKSGAGLGVTAVVRVGPPAGMRSVPRAVTAITIREPDSGSVPALREALRYHATHGFDPRVRKPLKKNARRPYLTVDMGYNVKDDWARLVYDHQYSPIGRTPDNWRFVHPSEHPVSTTSMNQSTDRPDPGPVMVEGAFLCPAAGHRHTRLATPTRNILPEDLDMRDRQIQKRLGFLMGINSRLRLAKVSPGRPSKTKPAEEVFKISLVCPALQGRMRCPLRPDSLSLDASDVPTAFPDWGPTRYECCDRMHVTLSLTERQAKEYQPTPPGSWEHAHLFEAYRALTEQQFSIAKNPSITNLGSLNVGPRREPFLKLLIGIAFAVSNLHIDDTHEVKEVDSYTDRTEALSLRLGRKPAAIPPRT